MERTYPRVKYRGVPVLEGQHWTENPGFTTVRVETPEAEQALTGEWHETPTEAVQAFNAPGHNPIHRPAPEPREHAQETRETETHHEPPETRRRR